MAEGGGEVSEHVTLTCKASVEIAAPLFLGVQLVDLLVEVGKEGVDHGVGASAPGLQVRASIEPINRRSLVRWALDQGGGDVPTIDSEAQLAGLEFPPGGHIDLDDPDIGGSAALTCMHVASDEKTTIFAVGDSRLGGDEVLRVDGILRRLPLGVEAVESTAKASDIEAGGTERSKSGPGQEA